LARVVNEMREDTVSDLMMSEFLQEENLLPRQSDESDPN
jgi:hypothetical protein